MEQFPRTLAQSWELAQLCDPSPVAFVASEMSKKLKLA